jgi:hypothetical protein
VSIAGYQAWELYNHLDYLGQPGMTWENRGGRLGWHVDHRWPVSSFSVPIPEGVPGHKKALHAIGAKCWAFTNLQPMWAAENIAKSDRLPDPNEPNPIEARMREPGYKLNMEKFRAQFERP